MNFKVYNELINPKDVCEEFGVEMVYKSNRIWIRCPVHKKVLGKEDRKISNCVLTPRGFHCWACGTTGDCVDIVANHLDIPIDTKKDKVEVAKLIAERLYPEALEGDDSSYKVDNRPQLPFSEYDLRNIGLCDSHCKIVEWPDVDHPTKSINPKCSGYDYDAETETYYSVSKYTYSLRDLFCDDSEGFLTLVISKAYEKYHWADDILKSGDIEKHFPKDCQDSVLRSVSACLTSAERILNEVGIEVEHKTYWLPMDFDDVDI